MKCIVVLLTLPLIALSAFGSQNAVVTLTFDPDHFLLDLNTLVAIKVANIGTEPLALSGQCRVHILTPDRSEFVWHDPTGEGIFPDNFGCSDRDDPNVQVKPGAASTFYLRYAGRGVNFLSDRHFNTPGAYEVWIEMLTVAQPPLALTSNRARLTIEEPKGVDAKVHDLIVAASKQPLRPDTRDRLARQIVNQYSTSRYMPFYVDGYETADLDVRESLTLFALQQPPPESFAEELRLALMNLYVFRMRNAVDDFNLQQAREERDKAQAMAERLTKSLIPFAAEEAKAVLDELPTREQVPMWMNERIRSFAASTAPVTPLVQCVDRGAGKDDADIVYFGYVSPNQGGKYIPHGPANHVQPESAVDDLPVYFASGHNPRVGHLRPIIGVAKPDEKLSWTLDDGFASLKDTTPVCVPPVVTGAVVPFFECQTGEGEGGTATFGYKNPNLTAIRVPLGPANAVSGEGNPPTVFLPGEHHGIFKIKGKEKSVLSWTLQGTTATAPPSGLPCSFRNGDGDHND